jgi:hypothetical protein
MDDERSRCTCPPGIPAPRRAAGCACRPASDCRAESGGGDGAAVSRRGIGRPELARDGYEDAGRLSRHWEPADTTVAELAALPPELQAGVSVRWAPVDVGRTLRAIRADMVAEHAAGRRPHPPTPAEVRAEWPVRGRATAPWPTDSSAP